MQGQGNLIPMCHPTLPPHTANYCMVPAQNLTADSTLEDFLGTMAGLPWNTDLARSLQDTVLESEEKTFCDSSLVYAWVQGPMPPTRLIAFFGSSFLSCTMQPHTHTHFYAVSAYKGSLWHLNLLSIIFSILPIPNT